MTFTTSEPVALPEKQCQSILAQYLAKCDVQPDFPLSTADVVRLLREGGEFAITDEYFESMQSWGQVPSVSEWDGRDIISAASALESRRQWMLTPSVHDPKKGTDRILLEQLMQQGEEGIEKLRGVSQKGIDLHLALILLTEAENRQLREKMLAIVQGILFAELDIQA
jgi:hypothetical protein